MRTADFHFDLPPELIAQAPVLERDHSRLLVWRRADGQRFHRRFDDLPGYLQAGDVLVLNDSRVLPARLRGSNARTGGDFEMLLLEENGVNDWWAMMRPGKRARVGTEVIVRFPSGSASELRARVIEINGEGHRRLVFSGADDVRGVLTELGEVPLPPYIERGAGPLPDDRERYQTVYARAEGSVAAPTAGLHFTTALLERLAAGGIEICRVTLHVGLGTFAPVKADALDDHVMHEERYEVPVETATKVNAARAEGRRVWAVGTTSVRVLESVAAAHGGHLMPGPGRTAIFIRPPFRFQIVDRLVTNFHLPCSTLLMLVSAFAAPGESAGREKMLDLYAEAVRERYRFFSYGDAMLIL